MRHLLANPSLKAYAPLQKEEQIISFLRINAGRLYPTLSSPDFFPGQSWNQIYKLLMQALYASTSESVVSGLKEFFARTINFHFLSFFPRPTGRSDDRETRLFSFMMKLIAHPLARKALTGPYSAIQLHLAHRYLDRIYDGRGYIRFELEKVQKLAMSQEEVKNLIRTSILLRPAVFLFQVARLPGQHEVAGLIPFQFAQKVIQALEKELPFYLLSFLRVRFTAMSLSTKEMIFRLPPGFPPFSVCWHAIFIPDSRSIAGRWGRNVVGSALPDETTGFLDMM